MVLGIQLILFKESRVPALLKLVINNNINKLHDVIKRWWLP